MHRSIPVGLLFAALACAALQGARPQDWEPGGLDPDWGEDAPGRKAVPQKMLPIRDVPYSAADRMKHPVSGSDLVIGVVRGGMARAYPVKMLGGPSREIINDRLGDEPYAVNW